MEYSRFLECLAGDFARLRAVVPADLTAAVPSCPGWTVADLARHVGEVYMHKTQAMRLGGEPDGWPPKGTEDEEPLALLDRSYTELLAEFAAREPDEPTGTWYKPDQTVGFWIRRMAQETVIHRIDAELGTGQPVAPIPDDLAIDGVDELLKAFVAFSVAEWGSYFAEILDGSPGRTYTISAGDAAWRVHTGPGVFTVTDGPGDGPSDVTVSGSPAAVLRWVWNRQGEESGDVTVEGPAEAVEELRRCIVMATQ
jgi:uncharacterized protein (TIGR03083 family)